MIEIRPTEKGEFDEIVGHSCAVHFEMMDNKTLWVSVKDNRQEYHIWISAKGKLRINVNDESAR